MQSIILSTHNFLTCFFINLSPSMGLFPLCLNYSLYNSCWLRLVDDNLLESLYYCSEMTLFYPRLWKIVLYLLFFHKWTSLLALFSSKEGGKLQVLFCLGYNHCYWKVSCQCNYCSVGVIYLLGLIFFFSQLLFSLCWNSVSIFFYSSFLRFAWLLKSAYSYLPLIVEHFTPLQFQLLPQHYFLSLLCIKLCFIVWIISPASLVP